MCPKNTKSLDATSLNGSLREPDQFAIASDSDDSDTGDRNEEPENKEPEGTNEDIEDTDDDQTVTNDNNNQNVQVANLQNNLTIQRKTKRMKETEMMIKPQKMSTTFPMNQTSTRD